MSPTVIALIREENQVIAAVLRSLEMRIAHARRLAVLPDFACLRAMVFYVSEVPARLHQPRKNRLLFPCLRELCPPLRPVLDRLEAEQRRTNGCVRGLEHALLAFEIMGDSRRAEFEAAAEGHAKACKGHMEVEESYVLPIAHACLTAADWHMLDAEFADSDPAGTHVAAQQYRALLRRVLFLD